jgi:uncharacterized Zn finger protein
MNMTCPHCGSSVTVEVTNADVKTIECDSTSCGATWDVFGQPVRTPEQFQAEVAALAFEWRRESGSVRV